MYDVNYFIEKFKAIPNELWYVGNYVDFNNRDSHCALGHCGRYFGIWTDESKELSLLFAKEGLEVSFVNDATYGFTILGGDTPKKRILLVLYSIRDKELSEANIKEATIIINDSVGDSSRIERIPQFEVQFDSE